MITTVGFPVETEIYGGIICLLISKIPKNFYAALLGYGTVVGGVYELQTALPELQLLILTKIEYPKY